MLKLLETKCVSSLYKVFPDEEINDVFCQCGSALRGEIYSFQVVYRAPELVKGLSVQADARALNAEVTVRAVGLVPSQMPCFEEPDNFILCSSPGLYPDPLYPLKAEGELMAYPDQWRALWVSVKIHDNAEKGTYPIKITITKNENLSSEDEKKWYGEQIFNLQVIPVLLPKQEIIHTEWFHTDCICGWYGIEPFSPRYWELVDSYMNNAVGHGINMLLTPLFTPPIDTKQDMERLTIQLVDITKENKNYFFNFNKLEKWISLCLKNGIEYLEMPHLFTQWGAWHAPKIQVCVNGVMKNQFGWHTDSEDVEYLEFLDQFLTNLVAYLNTTAMKEHVFFHVSDEPELDRLEAYSIHSRFVKSKIDTYPVLDAISDLELFKKSELSVAISATSEIDAFIQDGTENLWAYYACLQYKNSLSNRFFNMPSCRNRIIGTQLYKYNIQGFLHWGYNHWNSRLSEKSINPFLITDVNSCLPSGDAFLVYPGENDPVDSIRYEVLREAFQDHRAMKLLESYQGKERVMEILEEDIPSITFSEYPHNSVWIMSVREKINQEILKQ